MWTGSSGFVGAGMQMLALPDLACCLREKAAFWSCTKALAVCAGEGPASWPGFHDVGALPLG